MAAERDKNALDNICNSVGSVAAGRRHVLYARWLRSYFPGHRARGPRDQHYSRP